MRINALHCTKTINLDYVPKNKRHKLLTLSDGSILHSESRHPYEYPQNERYELFVHSGLVDSSQRLGHYLTTHDMNYDINVDNSVNTDAFISRLMKFYDIHHPASSHNVCVKEYAPLNVSNMLLINNNDT